MRITYLVLLFLCISCQLFTTRVGNESRQIAGIFEPTTKKVHFETEINLNQNFKWIILPNNLGISSVKISSIHVECSGKNFIKVDLEDGVIFYTQESSLLKCKSLIKENAQLTYHFYDLDLSSLNQDQISSLDKILNEKLSSKKLKEELISLDLYHLFHSKITIDELSQKSFKAGDIIDLKLVPKVYSERCPNEECSVDFNPVDIKIFYEDKFGGQNQLRYPSLRPFLFFCGTRYAAGNILYRSDRSLSLHYEITENGFSCDLNSFLLSSEKPKLELEFAHYSQEKIERILLSKKETLLQENRKLKKDKIKNFFDKVMGLNQFHTKYLNKNEETNTEKGYIEIWWEPYYECLIGNECIAKEFGVTKIRFIYQDNSLVEIENNLEFLHFKINNENQLNSIVQKICPSEIDQFVEDFLVAEESVKLEILAQSKTNCRLKTIDEKRVRFGKRSILHNFPIIFEDNEVDLKLENFKPYTESVPRDDFIDLINQRNTPYFKPRLIEVLNN